MEPGSAKLLVAQLAARQWVFPSSHQRGGLADPFPRPSLRVSTYTEHGGRVQHLRTYTSLGNGTQVGTCDSHR